MYVCMYIIRSYSRGVLVQGEEVCVVLDSDKLSYVYKYVCMYVCLSFIGEC